MSDKSLNQCDSCLKPTPNTSRDSYNDFDIVFCDECIEEAKKEDQKLEDEINDEFGKSQKG